MHHAAPAGHPAPRPEAGEHPARPRGPAARHRLRPGEEAGGQRRADGLRRDRGDAVVHGPEQASGTRQAITTATDVYGLGAILYAALTGRPPFQADSVLETLRQVQEKAVEPPSQVNRKVDRDLETICLKCLEKDPRRRYDSAGGPGRRPGAVPGRRADPGAADRARRAGGQVGAAPAGDRLPPGAGRPGDLAVGVAGITWQWREAVRQRNLKEAQRQAALAAERTAATERDKARAVNEFLTKKLLAQADPENNPVGDKVTLLEVLDRAAVHVGDSFAGQPEVEAAIQNTIAETYIHWDRRRRARGTSAVRSNS